MTRWLFLLTIGACGGGATPPPSTPPPAPAAATPEAAPSCREVISAQAKRFGMYENQDGSIAVCERQQWSADVRRCMARATERAQLAECGQLLPPASTKEIDAMDERSEAATRQAEAYAEQMCGCPDAACAQRVLDTATPWAKSLPPILKQHDARFAAAGERIQACLKKWAP